MGIVMEEDGRELIELVSGSNLERFQTQAIAVIPVQKDELTPLIGKTLGASALSVPAIDGLLHSGEQLAYIRMPEGFSPADCFARVDGFGGNTLSAKGFANGSWKAAAINPEIVAIAGFGLAAIMVIEKQLADINERLGDIESDIKSVVELLGIRRRSEIEGLYDRVLNDYVRRFDEYVSDPDKLQAARGEIERALTDVSILWAEQKNSMKALGEHANAMKHPKKSILEEAIKKFNTCEQSAATVLELSCALDRVRMFYDGDISMQRVSREGEHAEKRLEDYSIIHNSSLKALVSSVKEYEGAPLALASEDKVDKRNSLPTNAVESIAQNAGAFVDRLRKQAPWDAAAEKTDSEIDSMLSSIPSVRSATLCDSVLIKTKASLAGLGNILDSTDAMLYDGKNMYLLRNSTAASH